MNLYHCLIFPLVAIFRCFFYNKPKINFFCKAVITKNTKENGCITSHTEDTTALQPDLLLNGVHRWLVTKESKSSLLSSQNCPCKLQTPQWVTVVHSGSCSESGDIMFASPYYWNIRFTCLCKWWKYLHIFELHGSVSVMLCCKHSVRLK